MIEKVFAENLVIGAGDGGFIKDIEAGVLITSLISFFIIISFITAFFFLLQGALGWITSGGDEGKVEAARNRITQAIIGLVIVVAVWALFGLVQDFLGIQIFGNDTVLPTLGGTTSQVNCTYVTQETCQAGTACDTSNLCKADCIANGIAPNRNLWYCPN